MNIFYNKKKFKIKQSSYGAIVLFLWNTTYSKNYSYYNGHNDGDHREYKWWWTKNFRKNGPSHYVCVYISDN